MAKMSKKAHSLEYCLGYVDANGQWNNGFFCPKTSTDLKTDHGNASVKSYQTHCCGTDTHRYCCPQLSTLKDQPSPASNDVYQYVLMAGFSVGTVVLLTAATYMMCYYCRCCIAYRRRKRLHYGDDRYTQRRPSGRRNNAGFSVDYTACSTEAANDGAEFLVLNPPSYPTDEPPPYPAEERARMMDRLTFYAKESRKEEDFHAKMFDSFQTEKLESWEPCCTMNNRPKTTNLGDDFGQKSRPKTETKMDAINTTPGEGHLHEFCPNLNANGSWLEHNANSTRLDRSRLTLHAGTLLADGNANFGREPAFEISSYIIANRYVSPDGRPVTTV